MTSLTVVDKRSKSLNNASTTNTAYIQSVVANLSSCSNDLSVKKILQYGALFSSQSVSLEHVSPYLTAPTAAHNTNKCSRKRACLGNRSVCAAAPAICPWSSAAEAASLPDREECVLIIGARFSNLYTEDCCQCGCGLARVCVRLCVRASVRACARMRWCASTCVLVLGHMLVSMA